ncbi:Ribosomal L6 domain-containing protein [Citrus sinensis]|uniref:Ribosomal L6 domain-containing protein n=1 Tax=Citrus sinensis TaxID=2711 RepID=A0ACB8IET0_CITSI|nr:Ribosomal L6 domain-containing protein [Citrus sinensis]
MEAHFFWLLKIVGVGYKARAETEGLLYLKLGDVHHAVLTVPLRVFCLKNSVVCTQFAASVHSRKPTEPFKRKRIMYADEVIKRKVGRKEQINGGDQEKNRRKKKSKIKKRTDLPGMFEENKVKIILLPFLILFILGASILPRY